MPPDAAKVPFVPKPSPAKAPLSSAAKYTGVYLHYLRTGQNLLTPTTAAAPATAPSHTLLHVRGGKAGPADVGGSAAEPPAARNIKAAPHKIVPADEGDHSAVGDSAAAPPTARNMKAAPYESVPADESDRIVLAADPSLVARSMNAAANRQTIFPTRPTFRFLSVFKWEVRHSDSCLYSNKRCDIPILVCIQVGGETIQFLTLFKWEVRLLISVRI